VAANVGRGRQERSNCPKCQDVATRGLQSLIRLSYIRRECQLRHAISTTKLVFSPDICQSSLVFVTLLAMARGRNERHHQTHRREPLYRYVNQTRQCQYCQEWRMELGVSGRHIDWGFGNISVIGLGHRHFWHNRNERPQSKVRYILNEICL
jgi:hypothetical protein